MLGIIIGFRSQMPLAHERCSISILAKRLCNRHLLKGQVGNIATLTQFVTRAAPAARRQPLGKQQTGGIPAGHNGRPSRRADIARGIAISKSHAFIGQAIDVRRLVVIAAVAAQILPTQVVYQEKNDVGLRHFNAIIIGRKQQPDGR